MAYITTTDLLSVLSAQQITDAFDDDSSGDINSAANQAALNAVIAACSRAVDARLANIYPTPFGGTPPAKVADATLVFAAEAIAARRLPPDVPNPFKARAEFWREELTKIGHGELDLDQAFPRSFYPGNAILSPSKLRGSTA